MRRATFWKPSARPFVTIADDHPLSIEFQLRRARSIQIHSDGRVAALRPKLHPLGKSRAAAAMDEHHAGKLFAFLRHPKCDRRGVKGEHLRVLPQILLASIRQRLNRLILSHPIHRGHVIFERIKIPWANLFGRQLGQGNEKRS